MKERIEKVNFEEEVSQSYIDYAMSVITDRALPDVRDGLKPVQRRVIYAISQLTKSNTPHRKCARIVGDTMGKYHPHGDSSIYEALVHLAQDWKLNIPLIEPHGNFGSEDGSGAAAMRYTEARISAYIEDVCLKDLKYLKSDFVPNFDETETEPSVLSFQVPNLLISGTKGIAVGMAANIPPHNLGEVVDATIMYLEKDGKVTTEELLDVMPGPDFPTGGYINASKDLLLSTYETGLGKLKARGKIEIKDIGHGRKSICITEIPYTMIGSAYTFMQSVAELCRKKEFAVMERIDDIADRSSQDETCFAIDVKRGTTQEQIDEILNILYKKTGLEETYGVNINCLANGSAKVMGLKEILKHYTEFKRHIYNQKYTQLLQAEEVVLEVKNGLLEAVDCIDLIIEILRGAKNKADAKACLMTGDTSKIKFRFDGSEADARQLHFTEKQTDAILSMQLSQLIGLEIDVLKKDIAEANANISKYSSLLSSDRKMKMKMIKDLQIIKREYATPRKTVIVDLGDIQLKKEDVVKEDITVLIDRFFYIKTIGRSVYEKNQEQIDGEYRHVVHCTTTDRIAIFADDGQMHMIKIPDLLKQISKKTVNKKSKTVSTGGKLSDKGIQIFECFEMDSTVNLLYVDSIENFADKQLLMVFKNGKAKRVDGSVFDVSKKHTQAYPDGICYVGPTSEKEQIVAYSKNGMFIRVNVDEISIQGKGAAGVSLLKVKDDEIIYATSGTANDTFLYQNETYPFSRIKLSNRDVKGTKLRL